MNKRNIFIHLRNILPISIFFIVAFTFVFDSAFAQNTVIDNLKQNISSRSEDIKKLEEEIAAYKTQLDVVGSQKKTLQSALQTIDLSRAKLSKDIQLTQKKIEQANSTISDLDRSITFKERKIDQNKLVIASIIHKIDQSDSDTMLEILLANTTISEFFEDVDSLEKLQLSIRDQVKSLQSLKQELSQSKDTHISEKKKLSSLNVELGDRKEIADLERKSQASLLATTKNQESNYKKLLNEREARKKQFEKEIDEFEARLKAEIDSTTFPAPGTKALFSPVSDVRVTQKFGKTVDARRLYTSGTHNGMDFGVPKGTAIKSALTGTVVGTGDTDKACPGASYGRWVLIKHRNGLSTLYAHLELIKVTKGQEVETGETIAYSGNTGYSTGPHLHFTVYVASAVEITDFPSKSCKGAVFQIPVAPLNAYLDPQAYL